MGEGAEITFNQITFTYIIDMKFGPVTKLDKRNKTTSKHFNDDDMLEIVTSFLSFRFMATITHNIF